MSEIIRVPIAGIGIGKGEKTLFTVVGSCIAIMLYDKTSQLGGMIHIMLGYSKGDEEQPSKYVDTGVPYLIKQMVQAGAKANRLLGAKIAGGSQMYPSVQDQLNVSKTNLQATQTVLEQYDIQIIASDCGGHLGRRISFELNTGKVLVQSQGQEDKVL